MALRACKQCDSPFTVAPDDKAVLEKLGVPEPQLCAQCAFQRRLTLRNERHLYRRECELCHKSILAIYAPSSYAHVYCRECWYSDTWDPMSYGRAFDSSRPFLEQFFDLMREVPQFNLLQLGTSENSEYTNVVLNLKDCYLVFSCIECEGCVYGKNIDNDKDCVDCFNVFKSELIYQGADVHDSYRGACLTRCTKCTDCYLSRDLEDCQNCFGSVNLRHKQFHWFNKPLGEEEYKRRLGMALANRQSFAEAQNQFFEHAEHYPVEFARIRNSEDVTGDYVYNSTNARNAFDSYEMENVSDTYRGLKSKDVYRASHFLAGELLYEYTVGPHSFSCVCTILNTHNSFAYYSYSCSDCENILGCVGLRKKKFCILNKQYSEEGYNKLRAQIMESMKQSGQWGEFYDTEDSPHAYNDSLAHEFFPLDKEEVLKKGWRWNDNQGGTRGKETLKPEDIPDSIDKVPDTITKEILVCTECGMNYRIVGKELQVLRSLHMPLPRECHECRFKERLKRHNFPPLHHRRCMCTNVNHTNHPAGDGDAYGAACPREFETTYAPGRPEVVYCNSCYQEEIT